MWPSTCMNNVISLNKEKQNIQHETVKKEETTKEGINQTETHLKSWNARKRGHNKTKANLNFSKFQKGGTTTRKQTQKL